MGYFHNPDSTRTVSYTDSRVDAAALPIGLLPHQCSGITITTARTTKISMLTCLRSPKSHCREKLREEALLQALPFPPGTFLYPPESSHHLLQHPRGPPKACNPILAIDRENQHLLFASKQTGTHREYSSHGSFEMFVTCLYG